MPREIYTVTVCKTTGAWLDDRFTGRVSTLDAWMERPDTDTVRHDAITCTDGSIRLLLITYI